MRHVISTLYLASAADGARITVRQISRGEACNTQTLRACAARKARLGCHGVSSVPNREERSRQRSFSDPPSEPYPPRPPPTHSHHRRQERSLTLASSNSRRRAGEAKPHGRPRGTAPTPATRIKCPAPLSTTRKPRLSASSPRTARVARAHAAQGPCARRDVSPVACGRPLRGAAIDKLS